MCLGCERVGYIFREEVATKPKILAELLAAFNPAASCRGRLTFAGCTSAVPTLRPQLAMKSKALTADFNDAQANKTAGRLLLPTQHNLLSSNAEVACEMLR